MSENSEAGKAVSTPSVFEDGFAKQSGLTAIYLWLSNTVQSAAEELYTEVLRKMERSQYLIESGINSHLVTYTPDGRLYLLEHVLKILDNDPDAKWHHTLVDIRLQFRILARLSYRALQYPGTMPDEVKQREEGEGSLSDQIL